MSSMLIRKDLEDFQRAVKNLSDGVEKASSLWGDKKYTELWTSVSQVANISKDVILTGDCCCVSIDKMDKIAAELY